MNTSAAPLISIVVPVHDEAGNAGALAFPDILRQASRWLLDPLGPLAIPPAYFPAIFPWLGSATPECQETRDARH